jgi:hypothetical protein
MNCPHCANDIPDGSQFLQSLRDVTAGKAETKQWEALAFTFMQY